MGRAVYTRRLILCGFGQVGRPFGRLLSERQGLLQERYALDLRLLAVVDVGGAALAPRSLEVVPLSELLEHVDQGGTVQEFGDFGIPGAAGEAVIDALEADLIVETTPTHLSTCEPSLRHMRAALHRGMDVVAANAEPLVLHYAELQELAQNRRAHIAMGAATAAALPALDVGQACLVGANILGIEAILNGATNFILSKMQGEHYTYLDALQEAQARGLAALDPTPDVEGYDTAYKLILLANALLGTRLGPEQVKRRGIAQIAVQMVADARRVGKSLKLIGRAHVGPGGVHLTVAPEELPQDHPLAAVHGVEEAVTYDTDTMGRVTVMGGRASATGAAAALLKDIIHLVRPRPRSG
jgi:homoserine dehydrogenase